MVPPDIDEATVLVTLLDLDEIAVLAAMIRATIRDINEAAVLAAATPSATPPTIHDLDTNTTIAQSAIDGKVPVDDELPASTEATPEPAHDEQTQEILW